MIFRDPVLRLLPSSIPRAFENLDEAEQAWRGRVFLMTWALGGTESVSWAMAFNGDEKHVAEMKALVADSDDDQIRGAVTRRRNDDAAATRLGIDELR